MKYDTYNMVSNLKDRVMIKFLYHKKAIHLEELEKYKTFKRGWGDRE